MHHRSDRAPNQAERAATSGALAVLAGAMILGGWAMGACSALGFILAATALLLHRRWPRLALVPCAILLAIIAVTLATGGSGTMTTLAFACIALAIPLSSSRRGAGAATVLATVTGVLGLATLIARLYAAHGSLADGGGASLVTAVGMLVLSASAQLAHPDRGIVGLALGVLAARAVLLPKSGAGLPALRAAASEVRQLGEALEHAVDGVARVSAEGRFINLNASLAASLACRPGDLVGQPWQAAVHPSEIPRLDAAYDRMCVAGKVEHETLAMRRDGSTFRQRMVLVASRAADGTLLGHFQFCKDITVEHEAREELVRAKDAAEAGLRARSDFLARMSHEIRTPMNGIIGMTSLALETELTADQREYLEIVDASARGLLGVLNDILDFARIDVRKLLLEATPFDVRECLGAALRTVAHRAHVKQLELLLDIAGDVPERLVGDALRLAQVVINLVGNAVKFTERGEVVLTASVAARSQDGVDLYVSVRDTGIGIPDDKQALIFEAFSQGDGATSRRFGGTGLGLTICSQLVHMMDGEIGVRSAPLHGSTFWFTVRLPLAPSVETMLDDNAASVRDLPVLLVDDHPQSQRVLDGRARRADRPTICASRGPLSILIVEDNPVNQKLATVILRKAGHDVVAVDGGHAALDAHASRRFDVIVMDVQMPGMDGLATTRAIRAKEAMSDEHVVIIALTAQAMTGDRERCLASGMDGYLAKPFNKEALFAEIDARLAAPGAVPAPPPRDLDPAVDHDELARRTGGDAELVRDIAGLWADDAPRMLERLREALDRRDGAAVALAAHQLKGALLNVAARAAAATATSLEERGRRGALDSADHELAQLALQVDAVTSALAAHDRAMIAA